MMDTYWLEGVRGSIGNEKDEQKVGLERELKNDETQSSKMIKE